jgi:hypothetical protein
MPSSHVRIVEGVRLRLAVYGLVQAAQRDMSFTAPARGLEQHAAAAGFAETAPGAGG